MTNQNNPAVGLGIEILLSSLLLSGSTITVTHSFIDNMHNI